MSYDRERDAYVAPTAKGQATLTLDPKIQGKLERFLSDGKVPWGAAVLIEPKTGRVIAMAEHSRAEPGARGISLRALAPAASIFKIVTSAALLQQGIDADHEVCFHGGRHRLQPGLLRDDPRRDHKCATLTDALGHSTNVVFAKLASRGLSSDLLRSEASRFLFNTEIPFSWRVEPSTADIPDDDFRLAETAAGFGPVRMSPLHAALIGAMVANGGSFVAPRIVESADGVSLPAAAPRQLIEPEIASELARMMRTTVTEGTARRAFRQDFRSSRSPLHGVEVAGKTGSLADRSPYRDYSWFVGFAPVDDPQVAIAVVVVNEKLWHVRATQVAREGLAAYFSEHRELRAAAAPTKKRR
ncbi:MAG TPA: penicillin-binding transpeptidase domain-containing protein [Anaeromyxobacteraceae bacterium]|nr:penicillin-binding transpeptidase domain-containing protein [Anaeromyxobacteraceae bacterium]